MTTEGSLVQGKWCFTHKDSRPIETAMPSLTRAFEAILLCTDCKRPFRLRPQDRAAASLGS
jgi:hypothetical protein